MFDEQTIGTIVIWVTVIVSATVAYVSSLSWSKSEIKEEDLEVRCPDKNCDYVAIPEQRGNSYHCKNCGLELGSGMHLIKVRRKKDFRTAKDSVIVFFLTFGAIFLTCHMLHYYGVIEDLFPM